MPERHEPPDPQGEQTAPLTSRPEAPRQPTGPSQPDSVWAPAGQDDTSEPPPGGDDTRERPPGQAGEAAWPHAGQEAPTQPVHGWGGQSAADWDSPPTWQQQAQGAPPAWGQQPEGAGWGPPPSGGRSRRVPVAAIIAGALLVLVAIGAVVVVRGVQAVRTVASSATTVPAPSVPGTGNGGSGGGNGGGGAPGGSGGGGGSSLSGGSVRLPDQVDGLDRLELNEPGFLDGQQGMLDMVTRTGAIDGWGVGAYGHDAGEPRFVLLVVKAKEASTAGMLAGAMTDSIRNSLGGDLSEPTPFTRDGVRYDCSKGQVGNLCSFQDGTLIGIGFGRGGGLAQLSRLTADARHGVRS